MGLAVKRAWKGQSTCLHHTHKRVGAAGMAASAAKSQRCVTTFLSLRIHIFFLISSEFVYGNRHIKTAGKV